MTIQIDKALEQVFAFAITPPNSTLWLPGIVKEQTNEWPIRVGTIYTLGNQQGGHFKVVVSALNPNKFVEWTAENKNYHCRYSFKALGAESTELTYYEWVDSGLLEPPFAQATLEKLKHVMEL